MNKDTSQIGRRIQVIGNSCSGKTTLGKQIAADLGIPFIELDALNWQANWVGLQDTNPEEFERKIYESTAVDEWVVDGSYGSFTRRLVWPRVQTIIWLDLPRRILVRRMLHRSWRRSRSKELLWGRNSERFWPQLMLWRKNESLLWWILTQHRRKREQMTSCSNDQQWNHVHFIRLRTVAEVNELLDSLHRNRVAKSSSAP